jgi:hypothetical protein
MIRAIVLGLAVVSVRQRQVLGAVGNVERTLSTPIESPAALGRATNLDSLGVGDEYDRPASITPMATGATCGL